MPVQSIERHNISEMVFSQLLELISSGEWKPGDKIPAETELAETMGVSRVSIRAALQKLASLDLIERKQGRGTIVRNLQEGQQINGLVPTLVLAKPSLKSMNEFRMILECGAVELAALCRDDDVVPRLEENLQEMMRLGAEGSDCAEIDVDFHYIISEATKNPLIIKTQQVMRDSFLECMQIYKRITDRHTGYYYHAQLIEALRNRDAFGARKTMEEHLKKNQQDLELAIAEQNRMR